MSVAWNHRRRVEQAKRAVEAQNRAAAAAAPDATEREKRALLQAALDADCKRISALPAGSPERTALKTELLRQYLPMVEAYLAEKTPHENPVLVQAMIWSFDVGDLATAMRLADVAIAEGQPMPQRFKSDVRTFVADAVYDYAAQASARGEAVDPLVWDREFALVTAPGAENLYHAAVRIKYLKLAAQLTDDPRQALEFLELAQAIDPKRAQVKTAIAKLKKELEN